MNSTLPKGYPQMFDEQVNFASSNRQVMKDRTNQQINTTQVPHKRKIIYNSNIPCGVDENMQVVEDI